MKLFRKTSIQRKQMLIMMATSGVALLLACLIFSAYDVVSFRHSMVSNLSTLAEIVGNNSTAALDFNDRKGAEETLSGLRAEPNIIAAAVYNAEGSVFAVYHRFDRQFRPPSAQPRGHRFNRQALVLFQPIVRKGDVIGTVFLESDLRALYSRLEQYLITALVVFCVAALVCFLVSARLQRMVSQPILELVQTTRNVAQLKDFSVRVAKRSQDELGVLADGFNQMLEQIQQRDKALQASREMLEHRVVERTRELANSLSLTRATLESTTDGILVADGNGRITGFNENFLKIWNMPRELAEAGEEKPMLEFALQQLSHPERTRVMVQQTYASSQEESFALLEFKDGKVFECYSRPRRIEERCVGRVWTFRNITERKQAEEALRASEKKLNAITTSAKDGIIMFDDVGRISFWNPAAEEIFGHAGREVLGQNLQLLLTAEHYRCVYLTAFPHRAPNGEATALGQRLELSARRKSGQELIMDLALSSVPLEGRWVAIGIVRDISERKRAEAELAAAQKQLVEISRQAGMAEVATSVLHNVGNVLNSINVSATLADERLRKSRASDLGRLVTLLREHEADLPAFLASDSRSQKFIQFVEQIHRHLAREQATLLEELAALRKNIEHIKQIVAMQQSYAKISGVVETVDIIPLLEDALRMNAAALSRHNVHVVQQFSALPPLSTEKHKVLQILVNLISNAKYACEHSGRTDKEIILRVTDAPDRVKISVIDNGVGIPAENLTRIFNYGFTTRKNGHGFGLHSGALAAKALGGSLSVQSDGPGRGASFTLELPRQPLAS